MNLFRRVAGPASLLILTAACGILPGGGSGAAATPATVEVQRASMEFSVPAKGYLEAMKASPIAVPRVPTGALKVKELVDEGSIVEQGQIVVVFDDTQLNIELDNHQATFRSTDRLIDKTQVQSGIETGAIEVMKEVAELERDNVEAFKIVDESIYSRIEIIENEVRKDEADETIVFADASLLLRGEYYDIEERILGVEKNKVKGDIDRVETSLGSLVLKAPLGGLIVYKKNWRGSSIAVGDTLWPGNVVMSIVDPASTALTAFVLEKDAAGVETGASATVVADAMPQRTFHGKVTSVAEVSRPIERNSPVKYSEVKIEIEDGDPALLKPGMKAEARIFTGRADDAVVLPRSAVRGEPEQHYVLIESGSGPQRREVKTGPGDLVKVTILSGLEEGERVLLGSGEEQAEPAETPPAAAPPSTASSTTPAKAVGS